MMPHQSFSAEGNDVLCRSLIAWHAAAATQEALDSCPFNIEPGMSSYFDAELQVIFATLQLLHNSPQLTR